MPTTGSEGIRRPFDDDRLGLPASESLLETSSIRMTTAEASPRAARVAAEIRCSQGMMRDSHHVSSSDQGIRTSITWERRLSGSRLMEVEFPTRRSSRYRSQKFECFAGEPCNLLFRVAILRPPSLVVEECSSIGPLVAGIPNAAS